MSSRAKIIIIFLVPVVLILFWLYFLLSYTKQPNGDILQGSDEILQDKTGHALVSPKSNLDVTQKDTTKQTQLSNSKEKLQTINVYMPEQFANNGFGMLNKELLKDKRIFVRLKTFRDMKEYQNELILKLAKGSTDIDVFMVPTTWLDSMDDYGYKLKFIKDISPFFSYMFHDLVSADRYTYLPYAIDPAVTLVANDIQLEGDLNISNLKENMLVSTKSKASNFTLPIMFGIGRYDVTLLKGLKEPYEDYFLMLYAMVQQGWLSKDSQTLQAMMDMGMTDDMQIRDYLKYKKIMEKLSAKDDNCQDYLKACIASHGYSDIIPGFMSDMDVMQNVFGDARKSVENYNIYNFLVNSNVYPVRGRGFLINKNTKNIEAVSKFVDNYLQEGLDGNGYLWKNTFSAFNSVYDKQRLDKRFDRILRHANNFSLMQSSVNLQEEFVTKTKILDVLSGKYSLDAFLDNMDWKF